MKRLKIYTTDEKQNEKPNDTRHISEFNTHFWAEIFDTEILVCIESNLYSSSNQLNLLTTFNQSHTEASTSLFNVVSGFIPSCSKYNMQRIDFHAVDKPTRYWKVRIPVGVFRHCATWIFLLLQKRFFDFCCFQLR